MPRASRHRRRRRTRSDPLTSRTVGPWREPCESEESKAYDGHAQATAQNLARVGAGGVNSTLISNWLPVHRTAICCGRIIPSFDKSPGVYRFGVGVHDPQRTTGPGIDELDADGSWTVLVGTSGGLVDDYVPHPEILHQIIVDSRKVQARFRRVQPPAGFLHYMAEFLFRAFPIETRVRTGVPVQR